MTAPFSVCYLLGELRGAQIVAVRTCGEPSWGMTRIHGRSSEYVTLLEARAPSFQQASDDLRVMYSRYMPELAKRVPFPPSSRPTRTARPR